MCNGLSDIIPTSLGRISLGRISSLTLGRQAKVLIPTRAMAVEMECFTGWPAWRKELESFQD